MKRQWKPRIQLFYGRWRALVNIGLNPLDHTIASAITFCNRLNQAQGR